LQGLADQLVNLFFQGSIIADASLAFAGLEGGDGFGGTLSLEEAGPAEVGAVEFGRGGFAGTVGFAAGAPGGGDAAGQEGQLDLEGEIFSLHLDVYLH
jgi:hypothetical protein